MHKRPNLNMSFVVTLVGLVTDVDQDSGQLVDTCPGKA